MADTPQKILLCSCEDTMPLAADAVAKGTPGAEIATARHLCSAGGLDQFRRLAADGAVTVACTYQRSLFEEVAEDENLGAALAFVNIRETAGWSREAAQAGPKMAALVATARIVDPTPPGVVLESRGVTLIYGRDQTAVELAERLKDRLDITVLLAPGADVTPPRHAEFPIRRGRVRSVKGHLGAFEITIDGFAAPAPSSRGKLVFGTARDGLVSKADILIDVAGGAALVTAPDLRAGYLRADPVSPAAIDHLAFQASDLVGTFDKPRYIAFREDLCAHARSRITGCTRCLDLCPAGAITPAGQHVAIDANICGGCGACAAACPTGAAAYAVPPVDVVLARLRAMLMAYRAAGGRNAQILIHDRDHGAGLIDAAARFGDGLAARTLPLEVNETGQLGLEVFAAALAYGAASVHVLVRAKPRHDLSGLRQTCTMAAALSTALGFGEARVGLIETDDPDAMVAELASVAPGRVAAMPATFAAAGDKRTILKLALRELHRAAPAPVDVVALPKGAAFGRVDVRADGCTLCLACVSACPTRALGDAQDRPLLTFDESLCVQCGLCAATCPETVITLEPRLNFNAFEAGPITVKEEEPFCCIKCSKPFGVKSTIERIAAKLEEKHWMFTGANRGRIELIKMCEDCRVETAVNTAIDPFAGPPRPLVKTSEDYFREREANSAPSDDATAREADMLDRIKRGEA